MSGRRPRYKEMPNSMLEYDAGYSNLNTNACKNLVSLGVAESRLTRELGQQRDFQRHYGVCCELYHYETASR